MNKNLVRFGTAATLLATPAVTFAQVTDGRVNFGVLQQLLSPLVVNTDNITIQGLAYIILNYLILFAAILAIFYLIWAGIQYITAGTDEEKGKKARIGIYNAVIGIVVIVLSYMIIQYVSKLAKAAVQGSGNGVDPSVQQNGGFGPGN